MSSDTRPASDSPVCPECHSPAIHTPRDCNGGLSLVDTVCPSCGLGWHESGFNRFRSGMLSLDPLVAPETCYVA